jgi:hypothetical protein
MQIDPALYSLADNYTMLTNVVVPRPRARAPGLGVNIPM